MFNSARKDNSSVGSSDGDRLSAAKVDLHDAVRLAKDAVASSRDAANAVRDAAKDVKEGIRTIARDGTLRLRNLADDYSHSVTDSAKTVTSTIRSNPLPSAAVALGLGFVMGALFSARR